MSFSKVGGEAMRERPYQPPTLERKKNAAFIGAGLIALAGAVWTDTYSNAAESESAPPAASSTPSTAPETTFNVCKGEHYFCDRHTSQWVRCDVNVENYIKAQCEKFEFTAPMEDRGDGTEGRCRYEVYHVKCTPKR
jgi:hypothetical protein